MKRFKYKAKNAQGEIVTGEVDTDTAEHAARLIHSKGLVVISIENSFNNPLNFIGALRNIVSSGDLTNFTRQLATMINAGLPLTEALLILRTQSKESMQKIVGQILADIEEGEALSTAVSKYPRVFSKTYIALIKAGEVGGVLDSVLMKLADNLEKQQEFRGKVKGAMVYPIIVIVGMGLVALVMTIFVIPRMLSIYTQFGADLPITTKILMAFTNFVLQFWPIILILLAVGFYSFQIYKSTKEGRKKLDTLIFKIPIIGELQKQVILTDLTRTLSLMFSSGVSILEGLKISSGVMGNVIMSDALDDTAKMVEKGFPLAFAFSRHPEAFPFILSQMISVGEETGKMDEVLSKVSHVFETESDEKVKALTSAIEPIILIVLAVGVLFLVVSILLPIYTLTTSIST